MNSAHVFGANEVAHALNNLPLKQDVKSQTIMAEACAALSPSIIRCSSMLNVSVSPFKESVAAKIDCPQKSPHGDGYILSPQNFGNTLNSCLTMLCHCSAAPQRPGLLSRAWQRAWLLTRQGQVNRCPCCANHDDRADDKASALRPCVLVMTGRKARKVHMNVWNGICLSFG